MAAQIHAPDNKRSALGYQVGFYIIKYVLVCVVHKSGLLLKNSVISPMLRMSNKDYTTKSFV